MTPTGIRPANRPPVRSRERKPPSSARYIALANTLSIFIVTLGLVGAYIAFTQDHFQSRLAQFVYIERLRAATQLLQGGWDNGTTPLRRNLCRVFAPGDPCEPDQATPSGTDAPDRPAQGVKVFDIPGTTLDPRTAVMFAAVPIPFSSSESAATLLKRVFGNEKEAAQVARAFYVEFPESRHGWPVILIQKTGSEEWSFHFDDWRNMWFLRDGGHGMNLNPAPIPEWSADLPISMRRRIYKFNFYYFTVANSRINEEILKTARELTGRPYTQTNLTEAYQAVVSRPALDVSISGLPNSPLILSLLLPVVFFYAALIFRSSLRFIAANYSREPEPWLLLNADTAMEKMAATAWCLALCLSGVGVLAAFIIFDREASYAFVRLMFKLTGDNLYQMRAAGYESVYFGPKDNLAFAASYSLLVLAGMCCTIAAVIELSLLGARPYTRKGRLLELFRRASTVLHDARSRALARVGDFLSCATAPARIKYFFGASVALAIASAALYQYGAFRQTARFYEVITIRNTSEQDVPRRWDVLLDEVNATIEAIPQSVFLAALILGIAGALYYPWRYKQVFGKRIWP